LTRDRTVWPYIGVGCVTTAAGFFGGGMIGVFVGWIVGHIRQCTPPPESFPICGFFPYWISGMLLGTIVLPSVALTRLRRGRRDPVPTDERRNQGGTD
jgi:hypothetical protein